MEIVAELPGKRSAQPRGWWLMMADGKPRKFTDGIDFDCHPEDFRKKFFKVCAYHGWQGESRVIGSDVYLQVVGKRNALAME